MPEDGYPGIVLVHGGGGCAFPEWVEYWNGKGYAAIAIDTYGQEYGNKSCEGKGAPQNILAGPTDSGSFGNTRATFYDSWIYHTVCNVIFAHTFLQGLPDVDAERTCLTGISWGSVITEIVSGIDYRFKAFAPVYGTGYLLETPGCVSASYFKMPTDSEDWIKCFDPSTYLAYCNRPIMFSIGTNESYFNIWNNQRSSDLCKGEVYHSYRAELRHYHRWKDEEGMIHVYDFMQYCLYGNEMPFKILSEEYDGQNITITVSDSTKIKSIKVLSTSTATANDSSWKNPDLQVLSVSSFNGNTITIPYPAGAKYAYVEFSDKAFSEFFMSSKIYQSK